MAQAVRARRTARSTFRRGGPSLLGPALVCALALLAGCSDSPDSPDSTGPGRDGAPTGGQRPGGEAEVTRFASANPGSVNTYRIPAKGGVIVVDTLRTTGDARRAVAEIKRSGEPVVAVLLTHSHPDHVGGAGVFHEAFPKAPLYASTATQTMIRTDPRGFYPLTRSLPGSDFPARLTHPDRTFKPGETLEIGGVRLETAEYEEGESDVATVYYAPATGALFSGDIVGNRVTPALLEGHSCGWLENLERLGTRFPDATHLYPGHGAPGDPDRLMDEQRTYLQRFRALVRTAVAADSPGGAKVTTAERDRIVAKTERSYPGHPSVASLPTMMEENVKGVAREIGAEDPGTLPAVCGR
ncbi:MBL fold metallo-hydrolase [Streptomyces sp. NPDC018031]|uniref:MBL fold metallo-hydrolase n=1 Tax=Streptomyces sp. NPDC018031 TaxID=3365033 RepID=UPI00379E4A26